MSKSRFVYRTIKIQGIKTDVIKDLKTGEIYEPHEFAKKKLKGEIE